MTKIRLLLSAAFSVAALSLPAMAHAQQTRRADTICNDGTVMRGADANACRHHRGVRSMTSDDNRRPDRDRMENGRMTSPRGDVVEGRGGMTTAQMMSELHIDHTRNNATAKCSDGFYYHGNHDRSACSRDGGVSNWYK